MRQTVPNGPNGGSEGPGLWELVEWRAAETPGHELAVDDAGR